MDDHLSKSHKKRLQRNNQFYSLYSLTVAVCSPHFNSVGVQWPFIFQFILTSVVWKWFNFSILKKYCEGLHFVREMVRNCWIAQGDRNRKKSGRIIANSLGCSTAGRSLVCSMRRWSTWATVMTTVLSPTERIRTKWKFISLVTIFKKSLN